MLLWVCLLLALQLCFGNFFQLLPFPQLPPPPLCQILEGFGVTCLSCPALPAVFGSWNSKVPRGRVFSQLSYPLCTGDCKDTGMKGTWSASNEFLSPLSCWPCLGIKMKLALGWSPHALWEVFLSSFSNPFWYISTEIILLSIGKSCRVTVD